MDEKTAPSPDDRDTRILATDEMLAINQLSAEATTRMNARVFDNTARMHIVFLDFTKRRLTANFETAKHFARGGRLEDAAEAVFRFQQQAVLDYAAQARRLVRMCSAMTGELIQEIEDEVSEGTTEASSLAKFSTSRAAELLIREIENLVIGDIPEKGDTKSSAPVVSDRPLKDSGNLTGETPPGDSKAIAVKGSDRGGPKASIGDGSTPSGPVMSLKVAPAQMSEADLRKAILKVLAETGKPMTLVEIASVVGSIHYAALIRPMRSLCAMARVAKDDKTYRLS